MRAARQAAANARDIRLWLKPPTVEPLVVLWGAAAHELDRPRRIGEATVVGGPHLKACLVRLSDDGMSPNQIETAWRKIEEKVRTQDPREPGAASPLRIRRLDVLALTTVIAAGAGFYLAVALATLPWSLYWSFPACVALAAAVMPTRHKTSLRFPMIGWLTGVGFAVVAVVTDTVARLS